MGRQARSTTVTVVKVSFALRQELSRVVQQEKGEIELLLVFSVHDIL